LKITELKTWVVGNPPPYFGGRYFIFLQLATDTGIKGIGEVYAASFGPHTIVRMIEDVCERRVMGRDPFQIERMWRDIYSSTGPSMTCSAVASETRFAPIPISIRTPVRVRSSTTMPTARRPRPADTWTRASPH
jgi:L-alanine-DL-glutamate epimerase-like enolase superfamily enzyme